MSDGTVLIAAAGWHCDAPGGANKLPSDFARFLAARRYRVSYVCPSKSVDRITRTCTDGIDLRRYPAPDSPSPSFANAREHWRLTADIARAVNQEQPVTVLLGHTQLQYLAAAHACASDVRRCYAVHSPFAAELRESATGTPSVKQRLAWSAASLLERRILATSDVVHCDSAYTCQLMESEYSRVLRNKTIVLPGWVDTNRFQMTTVPRADLRARLGHDWQAGVPTFFTLRRLYRRMGLDTLIEAAAILARDGREFRIVIGGDGPERLRLEVLSAARGLADRVSFLGLVPEQDLVDSFRAADCFVLPTRSLECFGLIVLEAYACGVPVIGVPVGSIPEVMGPEFRDWLADDNEPAGLARRMRDFLDGRLAADPMKLRRRALAFEMHAVAAEHERVLLQRTSA